MTAKENFMKFLRESDGESMRYFSEGLKMWLDSLVEQEHNSGQKATVHLLGDTYEIHADILETHE